MSDIIKRYFIADGEKAQQVIAEIRANLAEQDKLAKELVEKYQGDTTWGRRDHTHAIAVKIPDSEPPKREGMKASVAYYEGDRYAIYSPDRRYKKGLEFEKDLDRLNHKSFNFSSYAVSAFEIGRSVVGQHATSRTGMAMYHSVAVIYGDRLVFMIPFGGCQEREPDMVIPPELREIKKSEFIAITEEGAAA